MTEKTKRFSFWSPSLICVGGERLGREVVAKRVVDCSLNYLRQKKKNLVLQHQILKVEFDATSIAQVFINFGCWLRFLALLFSEAAILSVSTKNTDLSPTEYAQS